MKTHTMKHTDRNWWIAAALKPVIATFLGIQLMLPLWGQLERDSVKIILDIQELREVKAADLDGDGDDDIIGTRNAWDGHLAFFENTDGQGTLAWPVVFGDSTWGQNAARPHHFELGDMDGDGDLDIVDGLSVRKPFPYLDNDGQGHFNSIGQPLPEAQWVEDYDAFRVADMDGDGWLDVLFYNSSNRRLYVNWNQGAGQPFVYEEITFLGFRGFNEYTDLELSDYDQDGDLDILIFSTIQYAPEDAPYKSLLLEIVEAENGTYQHTISDDVQLESYEGEVRYVVDVSMADLNEDGFPDLIYNHRPNGWPWEDGLKIWRNNGLGGFVYSESLSGYQSHTLIDVDQDGGLDIIAVKKLSQPGPDEYVYEWLENGGNLDLTPHMIDASFTGLSFVQGDLNSDGLADLLTYNLEGFYNSVLFRDNSQLFIRYAQSSSGEFSAPAELTEGFVYIMDIGVQDLNSDGQEDILIAVENGIRWIENTANGDAFSIPVTLWEAPASLSGFEFVHLNNDGSTDGVGTLSSPNLPPHHLFVWLSGPSSSGGTIIEFPDILLSAINKFVPGQLDADADNDILVCTTEGQIAVLWNELDSGGGLIEEVVLPSIPVQVADVRQLLITDLDQNGGGDIVMNTGQGIYYALHLDNNGAFDDWRLIAGMDAANKLFAGDYNADGVVDIRARLYDIDALATASYDTSIQSFTVKQVLGAVSRYAALAEVDLNSDDIPDLLDNGGFALSIGASGYITDAYIPAPFETRLSNILSYNPIKADLDGDGIPELITGLQGIAAYHIDFLTGSTVEGLMLWDTTANCTFDSLYPAQPNGQLSLNSGISQQHTTTTPDGHYAFYLPDVSQHLLSAIPLSDYWNICPADTLLAADGPHSVHFAASANTLCPLLELDMAISQIRQCFPSTVSMAYRNIGTTPAAPVSITLNFDERMTPISSAPPWTIRTDTSLVFEFTEVGVGEEGQIVVEMEPDCQNLVLGEVLCYEARITPDTLCGPLFAQWDGASLHASFFCEGDSVAFRVENAGNGAMATPEVYQLNIVNDDIVLLETDGLQLGAGEADTIRAPAGTDGFLFEVGQPDGHPHPEPISLLAGGCLSPLDTNLLNAFPGSNGDGFAIERCGPVIGPFDPNIKVAAPEGYGEEHLITAGQSIQYTIHFQNVGTDMAGTVTIRDALSDQLDLATFQAGPASHAYEWIILPGRTLTITFPGINLPDSTSSEAESHGFFSYTIEPVKGILPFTRIENEAAIYFDFNPPIITNRTEHLIQKPIIAESIFTTLCPGELYLGQMMVQDSILKQVFEMPEKDSIIWHHVNVLTIEDTTEIAVILDEPGVWQGIAISQDTIITETLESTLGCDSIISYQITILTHLDSPVWAQGVRLSPNPAREMVHLSWRQLPAQQGRVRIFQSIGQLVAEQSTLPGGKALSWDVRHWPSGVYWVEMEINGQRERWRLVVE